MNCVYFVSFNLLATRKSGFLFAGYCFPPALHSTIILLLALVAGNNRVANSD